jgi:hypothetical protein
VATKLALKRLTASDLTLFEHHFREHNAGNQKAINLNADVFIDRLYPALPEAAQGRAGRLPLDLFLYGPGLAPEWNLQRKIIKFGTYKNWRLDGEYIPFPTEEPERFNVLVAGDIIALEFYGDIVPTTARAVLLAQALPEDAGLHAQLDGFLAQRSMATISVSELRAMVDATAPSDEHPIHRLSLEAELEDAALGGVKATRSLLRRPSMRKMTQEDLRRARQAADDVGRAGEEFVYAHLLSEVQRGRVRDFEWVSRENAIAPYDFRKRIGEGDGVGVPVEVKSTSHGFDRPIHFSANELLAMAEDERYEIYRVFELGPTSAKLRVGRGATALAREVLEVLGRLPGAVAADSMSIEPSALRWDAVVNLSMDALEPTGSGE